MNANNIFVDHRDRRALKIKELQASLEAEQRTLKAALFAAGSAEATGDNEARARYLREADKAETKAGQIKMALEEVKNPIPLEEGRVAWEEHSSGLNKRLAQLVAQYEENREELADDLRNILNFYDEILADRGRYAIPCGLQTDLQKVFPVFRLTPERLKRDILFYRHTGDFTESEAEYYTEQIKQS